MKNIEKNMSKKIFVLDTCSIGKFCNDQDFKIEELTNIQLNGAESIDISFLRNLEIRLIPVRSRVRISPLLFLCLFTDNSPHAVFYKTKS